MSHTGHETVMCQICGNIIRTCRCIDKNKTIRYEACEKCQEKDNDRKDTDRSQRVRSRSQ